MKAYIDVQPIKRGYFAQVVSTQDYHEGGPHAHSHETDIWETKAQAKTAAKVWAEKYGYTITTADEVARG